MNIPNEPSKVKAFLASHGTDIFIGCLAILMSIIGFGIGRLSALYKVKVPLRIEYGAQNRATSSQEAVSDAPVPKTSAHPEGPVSVVASKKGTRYYFPWCDGVERLSEKNKISFATEAEAKVAGYTLAANCK